MSQYYVLDDYQMPEISQYPAAPSNPFLDERIEYDTRSPTIEITPRQLRLPSVPYSGSVREELTSSATSLERSEKATSLARPGQPIELGFSSRTTNEFWLASEISSRSLVHPDWAREQGEAHEESWVPHQLPSLREALQSLEVDHPEHPSPTGIVEENILYGTLYNPPEMTLLNSSSTPVDSAQSTVYAIGSCQRDEHRLHHLADKPRPNIMSVASLLD
ncbi:hypothetical protein F4818DRAFT_436492 [Hypoxylon cercidicola]|nr:hypothetical protein F4818DRAFT_436492 [Hypoxylon cercidicola]